MKRRSFVASLMAATVVGCAEDKPGLGEDLSLDLAEVMRAYYGSTVEDARAIGSRYGAKLGSFESLADDLLPVVDLVAEHGTIEDAVAALRQRVAADFETLDMTLVDGWALGSFEARVAGVADYVAA